MYPHWTYVAERTRKSLHTLRVENRSICLFKLSANVWIQIWHRSTRFQGSVSAIESDRSRYITLLMPERYLGVMSADKITEEVKHSNDPSLQQTDRYNVTACTVAKNELYNGVIRQKLSCNACDVWSCMNLPGIDCPDNCLWNLKIHWFVGRVFLRVETRYTVSTHTLNLCGWDIEPLRNCTMHQKNGWCIRINFNSPDGSIGPGAFLDSEGIPVYTGSSRLTNPGEFWMVMLRLHTGFEFYQP